MKTDAKYNEELFAKARELIEHMKKNQHMTVSYFVNVNMEFKALEALVKS